MAYSLKCTLYIPILKKGDVKECSNCRTPALISHASTMMLKVKQQRLPPYVQQEIPDGHAGFRKGRGTQDLIASICWLQ